MAELGRNQARFVLEDGRVLEGRIRKLAAGGRYALAVAFPAGSLPDDALDLAVVDQHTGAVLAPDGEAGSALRGTWELPARFRLEEAPPSVGMEWSPATADTAPPEPAETAERSDNGESAGGGRGTAGASLVTSALPMVIAALTVAATLVGGTVAASVGKGGSAAGGGTPLTVSCPTPPALPGTAGALAVGCNALKVVAAGEIQQVVDLAGPTTIAVGFGFCSGFTCGDADPECLANLWIPGFSPDVIRTVTLTPPAPGATLKEVVVGAGKDPRSVQPGTAPPPTFGTDGTMTVDVPSPLMSHFRTHPGRVCGLSDAEHTAFLKDFPTGFDNSGAAAVRLLVTWSVGAGAVAGPAGALFVNGAAVTFPAPPPAPTGPVVVS